MSEKDFESICSKIDEEKAYLNSISQDIWKMPELKFKEVHAHATLTGALCKYGFRVEKHYLLTTAFKAEYQSKLAGGPTIAILLEYDALPDIGHACGHNLIAESGLAAAIAVKQAMEQDNKIAGKLIVLGTPAEECGGGKIRLIELGAFEGIDAAMMVHPARVSMADTSFLSRLSASVQFYGKEAHASGLPWEGINALDAAVACYNNISLLRQQMKPNWKIHGMTFCAPQVGGSTDMGNVSHILPSIHPKYRIPTEAGNHTKGFTEAAGSPAAQEPTLIAAKAMAMTCLTLMRSSQILEEVKVQFQQDILKDTQT